MNEFDSVLMKLYLQNRQWAEFDQWAILPTPDTATDAIFKISLRFLIF